MAFLSRISAAEHEDGEDRMPLSGLFREAQLRPLDELVEEMRPMVSEDLTVSMRKARKKARELGEKYPGVTEDERAILTLYTIEMQPPEKSFYYVLNEALRARDRSTVKPWRDVIWLLLTAMRKLPPVPDRTVQRGVKKHCNELGRQAQKGREFLWAAFTSTTTHVESLQVFLGKDGGRTKWSLHLRPDFHAVRIQDFSLFPSEYEVLLPPNLEFEVKSTIDYGHGLSEVQCEQVEETDPLMNFTITGEPSTSPTLAGSISTALKKAKPQEDEPSTSPTLPGPSSTALEKAKAQEVDWYLLAQKGGGEVDGKAYTTKDCYIRALELNEKHAKAWYNLGNAGGGTVSGQNFEKKDCYIRSLELDEKDTFAWGALGFAGGGKVSGQNFEKKDCYIRALELDEKHAYDWLCLGNEGGGKVSGQNFGKKDCYIRSLELDGKKAWAWHFLGNEGGGTVSGQNFEKKDCYIRALELDEKHGYAWSSLGEAGGGTVHGHFYDSAACRQKAATLA